MQAFSQWIALPSVRAALNISPTFPDDVKWGGTEWSYPFSER
jgi:hypothetical protein